MRPVWRTHLGEEVAFDPAYHDVPRVEIASFVDRPPGLVLDIGCGAGATGRLLKEKFPGTRVIGIELEPRAAEHAGRVLDEVICGSIDAVSPLERTRGEAIGTVLLLDVLEHLRDPWRALERIRSWIAPETRVLASVPNVRNLATLDALAAGRWEYARDGALDITHLRFFTRASLRQMFEQTGYEVRHLEPLTRPEEVDPLVLARLPGRLQTRHLSVRYRDLADLEDLYTFQFVVDARPAGANAPTAALAAGAAAPGQS